MLFNRLTNADPDKDPEFTSFAGTQTQTDSTPFPAMTAKVTKSAPGKLMMTSETQTEQLSEELFDIVNDRSEKEIEKI